MKEEKLEREFRGRLSTAGKQELPFLIDFRSAAYFNASKEYVRYAQ